MCVSLSPFGFGLLSVPPSTLMLLAMLLLDISSSWPLNCFCIGGGGSVNITNTPRSNDIVMMWVGGVPCAHHPSFTWPIMSHYPEHPRFGFRLDTERGRSSTGLTTYAETVQSHKNPLNQQAIMLRNCMQSQTVDERRRRNSNRNRYRGRGW